MSNFDILEIENNPSFIKSLNKRKALGLDSSDEEDKIELTKPKKLEDPTKQTCVPPRQMSTKNTPNQTALRSLSSMTKEKLAEEKKDDLDPDLVAYLKKRPKTEKEPEKINIVMNYIPANNPKVSQRILDKLTMPMKVVAMNNVQFDNILNAFCKHKELIKSNVMLSYKEAKVFLKGTPAGLDMVGPKTYVMQVYPAELWQEKLQKEEERISEKQWKSSQPETEDIVLVEQDTKIMINLKGSDRTEVKIRVKPSTLLSAVTKRYKIVKRMDGFIQLYFQGELLSLDSAISETELEDEDILQVVVKGQEFL
ncbi:unnamed protein product [Rhizopus stolonifer]